MLDRVREDRRYDWQDSQRPPRGYDRAGQDRDGQDRGGYDRGDNYRDPGAPRHRPEKASVGMRVLSKALIAIVILGMGLGGYVLTRGHNLGSLLSLFTSPSATEGPAASSSPATGQPAATPQTAAMRSAGPGPTGVPNVPTMVILIRNVIVALDQANTSGNYSVLRALAAPGFQQATTPDSLTKSFGDLRARDVDLSQISVVNPRLASPPALTKEGLLRLTGAFPVSGHDVTFDMLFQMVANRWMLFGLAVQPSEGTPSGKAGDRVSDGTDAAAATPRMPDNGTLVTLIRSSVLALSQANLTGDYSVLHDISSPGMQRANDAKRLSELFAALRGRNLDLAPLAVIDPRLFKPASVDDHGYLRLTGYFPSRPEQVNFDLAFEFAAGEWRLFGIGLNTTNASPTAAASPAPGAPNPAQQTAAAAASPAPQAAAPPGKTAVEPPLPRLRPTQ